MSSHRHHRHFVAVPLFVAFMSASFLSTQVLPIAAVTSQVHDGAQEVSAFTMAKLLDAGVMHIADETVYLSEGSLLVSSEARSAVRALDAEILGSPGAFYVTVRGHTLTVAALTTPVLVRDQGARILIPTGSQWRRERALPLVDDGIEEWLTARKVHPLPEHFLREKLTEVSSLPERRSEKMLPALHDAEILQAFKLPAARERSSKKNTEHLIESLRLSLEEADLDSVRDLLVDPFFETQEGKDVLLSLLQTDDAFVLNQLLALLIDNTSLRLLLAVHPEIRAPGWSVVDSSLTREEALALLVALPQSDTAPKPLSTVVLKRWREDTAALVRTLQAPDSFLAAWIDVFVSLVDRYNAADLPLRSEQLHQQLVALSEEFSYLLDDDIRDRLHASAFQTFVPDASDDTSTEEVGYSPLEVEQMAYDLLKSHDALFTIETKVTAVSPRTADISGIVFGTKKGDRQLDFMIDVVSGKASQIVLDGKTLPNSLPLADVVAWLHR